ncbi:MAG: sugar ABC transporter permease [Hungatella sp.]
MKRFKKSPNVSLLLFCLPFLILFLVFFIYPFLNGIWMSFTNSNGFTKVFEYVGFRNYLELLKDKRFLESTKNTLLFTVLNVVIGNVLALLLAFVIESGIKGKNFFRTTFFLPYVFALIVIGFVWKFIFTQWLPQFAAWSHLSFLNQDFLGNPKIAIYATIIVQIWYQLGYYMIIYIAGMQSIDKSLLEAARIDGAGAIALHRRVVLPLLVSSISICLFTGIASSFKAFDSILSLTGGGPGYATEVLSLNIYYEAMGDAQRYGYGMAKAIILAGFIFIVTMIQRKICDHLEVEN